MRISDLGAIKKTKELTEALMKEQSIKDWHESLTANQKNGHATGTIRVAMSGFRKFIRFLSSGKEELTALTLDELLTKALESKKALFPKTLINDFYSWCQGLDVKNYQKNPKSVSQPSAKMVSHSNVRGFFTHNGVVFGKFRSPKSEVSTVKKTDRAVPLIKEDADGVWRLNETFFTFYNKLRFRDQVVLACQLSGGGHDLADLFKLKVGDVRDTRNFFEEFFVFEGNRQKTNEPFTAFFSASATSILKQYTKNERKEAEDEEALFVYKSKTGKIKALKPTQVGQNFYRVAKELGFENGNSDQNPFRPKRFRSLFNRICLKNGLERDIVKQFQGHSTSISENYTNLGLEELFKEYRKVSKYLDVIPVVMTDADEKFAKLEAENKELKARLTNIEEQLKKVFGAGAYTLSEQMRENVEELKKTPKVEDLE